MEQMNLFDYMDEIQGYHLCSGCARAKYKERTRRIKAFLLCRYRNLRTSIET